METSTTATEKEKSVADVLDNSVCDLNRIKGRLHFIGIGGIGMSALARLLLSRGIAVSGSDKYANAITEELSELGAKIYIGHETKNAVGASAIVVSTAITSENPELSWAKSNGCPIWHRSQILAALAKGHKSVAVSGTHGKTTTTGMLGKLLIDAGLDPSIVLGGVFTLLKSNCRAGKSNYFVAEADESDGTHVSLPAEIAVITNVEADHLENYPGGMPQILDAMLRFASQATDGVVLCLDDQGCQNIAAQLKNRVVGYGEKGKSASRNTSSTIYLFEDLSAEGKSAIRIYKNDKAIGIIDLSVPGKHNQYNATAAAAVGLELGIDFKIIADSLGTFSGVDRRFQIIGKAKDILIVDDYAHHPTEVVATLQAAKQFVAQNKFKASRIVAVFQPHQPGRLKDFWQEFCQAFQACDLLLVADVYIARGQGIAGIDSNRFTSEVNNSNAHYLSGPTKQLASQIKNFIQPHDLVITIGAGDITTVGPALLQLLEQ